MPFATAAAVFADSRALAGANRWYGEPAVELRALGPAAADGAAQGRWLAQVVAAARALDWPAPDPRVAPAPDGARLAFRAPRGGLASARALNEWAWEQAASAHPQPPTLLAGAPAEGDFREHLRRLWVAERSAPLERLLDAADRRKLPWHLDADTLSIGEGRRALHWPRAALPWPADVPWQRLGSVPRVLLAGAAAEAVAGRLHAVARHSGFQSALGCPACAGASWARQALRDPSVDALLLVQQAADVLEAGVAVPAAEVAVIGAPEAERAAALGLADPEALAAVLLALAHPLARSPLARARLVLDGRSESLLRAALQRPQAVAAEWAFYADDHDAALLQALRRQGGSTCGARAGRLLLWLDGVEHDLGPAGSDAEATAAAAAAGLAAACLGWPLEVVSSGLTVQQGSPLQDRAEERTAGLATPAD